MMHDSDNNTSAEVGVIGLGLLSRNLILATSRLGYAVAGHDPDPAKIRELLGEAHGLPVTASTTIEQFTRLLCQPRCVLMLMSGGPHLDEILHDLCEYLETGDLVVDGGCYHHIFTPWRRTIFSEHGIHYVAVGVGAPEINHDSGCSNLFPSLQATCRRVRPVFGAVAAHGSGEPCVTFIGQQVELHLGHLEKGTISRGMSAGS